MFTYKNKFFGKCVLHPQLGYSLENYKPIRISPPPNIIKYINFLTYHQSDTTWYHPPPIIKHLTFVPSLENDWRTWISPKRERRTYRQTDRQTEIATSRLNLPRPYLSHNIKQQI